MYPANKDQDAAQSGTGIYYQAVPAVAANGKNIMKLIPVQMVNGQFIQTDTGKPRTDSTPHRSGTANIASAPVVKKAALNPLTTQQSCSKQVSSVNDVDRGYSHNIQALEQQTKHFAAKDHTIAKPTTNCNKSVRRPCRLPVRVTSSALPKGHHILIPPDAHVLTVPASDLPPGIKKHICRLSGNSSPELNLDHVVFVSPVTTISQCATPPNDSATVSVSTSNRTSHASQSKGSKPHLKLIPKVSERPNSPTKWVIEEDEIPTAPNRNHLDSSSVTSENLEAVAMRGCDYIKTNPTVASGIIRSLVEREKNKHCDDSEKTISQSILNKSAQGQENALVMYKGKVYFMAKKCSLSFKVDQRDKATSTKNDEFNRTSLPSSQQTVEPITTQAQQGVSIVIPDESDEIIDLCDDEDSTQQEASVDEDNVIFVSYIPPKAEFASQANSMLKSQMAPEKETTKDTNRDVEENFVDGRTANEERHEDTTLTGRQAGQSLLVNSAPSVYCSSVMNSNAQTEEKTSTQQVQSVNIDLETGNPAHPNLSARSNETCSEEKDTHIKESCSNPPTYCTTSLAQKPCRTADHLLRKKFGITTNVNIRLQRIDETSAWLRFAQPPETKSTSKANRLQDINVACNKRVTDYSCVKKVKLLNGSESSARSATSHSLCGSSSVGEPAPEFGYVEPIDEDFFSRHEDNLKLQTCVELNTNTSRPGRTRKRTMCPCCSTGTLEHEADRLA